MVILYYVTICICKSSQFLSSTTISQLEVLDALKIMKNPFDNFLVYFSRIL